MACKCQELRREVPVGAYMVGTYEVDGDLRFMPVNRLVHVSILYCVVRNRFEQVLTWGLYCVMLVTGEIRRSNTKFECMSGNKVL